MRLYLLNLLLLITISVQVRAAVNGYDSKSQQTSGDLSEETRKHIQDFVSEYERETAKKICEQSVPDYAPENVKNALNCHTTNKRNIVSPNSVEDPTELLILLIISQIQANHIKSAITYYNTLEDKSVITRIVTDAYDGKLLYFNNVMNFIRETQSYQDQSLGYTALFNAMESNKQTYEQEIFNLAYAIFEILNGSDVPNKDQFELLKKRFAQNVQLIVWQNTVCLKSVVHNNYLYAPNDYFAFDSDRGRVFGWIPGNQIIEGDWKFEAQHRAEYFYLQNAYRKQYIYSPNNFFNYDKDRRNVFMWRPGHAVSNGDWIVKLINDKNISLFSRTNQQYLYAASDGFNYDSNRRSIFSWIPGGDVTQSPLAVSQC